MQDYGNLILLLIILFSSLSSILATTFPSSTSLSSSFSATKQVNLGSKNNYEFHAEYTVKFDNSRLKSAYDGLQAWKKAITSDPLNFTNNWDGPDVCKYNGVFCTTSPDDQTINTVAGIDLNQVDMAGNLPVEIGLLTDVSFLHINSNRFHGAVPKSIYKLKWIKELDLSNNNFAGPFPKEVLSLPNLKYLDLRFNSFEGELPSELFDKKLDALFLNDNKFTSKLPDNFGNSPASVIVLANNQLEGCIPSSIAKMNNTLEELVLFNNRFDGCLSSEVGFLSNAKIFDVENNSFFGTLPITLKGLTKIERLNLAHNQFTGFVSDKICGLPKLGNFTFSYNYFNGEDKSCIMPPGKDDVTVVVDDTSNCLPQRPNQKSQKECVPVLTKSINCPYSDQSQPSSSPPSQIGIGLQDDVGFVTGHAEFSLQLGV